MTASDAACLTPVEFDALFDAAHTTVFRLEAMPSYAVPTDDASLLAFRNGTPRPVRSVRTNPWLRRVAVTTAAGVRWSRVRVVVWPLNEYTRWELLAYVESQSAGEEILLVDHDQVGDLGPDYWLFDGGTEDASAVVLRYSPAGALERFEQVKHAETIAAMHDAQQRIATPAQPLNVFLAEHAEVVGVRLV